MEPRCYLKDSSSVIEVHRCMKFRPSALKRLPVEPRNARADGISRFLFLIPMLALACASHAEDKKPAITLDEYLNTTDIVGARLSPDGTSAVIGTESPDWKASTYRHTLWLWTLKDGLRPLTQSGSDEGAEWSPDGKWIAFLSDRPVMGADDSSAKPSSTGDGLETQDAKRSSSKGSDAGDDGTTRLWLIPVSGGEAQPLYREKLEVHAFAWSPDGKSIYASVPRPLSQAQQDADKENWKDVIRWREHEHGDLLLGFPVEASLAHTADLPTAHAVQSTEKKEKHKKQDDSHEIELPAGARTLAESKLEIMELAPAPDGKSLAFLTQSVSHRMENPADTEIFLLPTGGGKPDGGETRQSETGGRNTRESAPRQLTHNEGLEAGLRWSPDGRWLHFAVHAAGGSVEGKYSDIQGRLYRLSPGDGSLGTDPKIERLGSGFTGSFDEFAFTGTGELIALGLKGLEEQVYRVDGAKADKLSGISGMYSGLSTAKSGTGILVRISAINRPAQVYLAADLAHLDHPESLTQLNQVFERRAEPQWKPYTWQSADGTSIEGVLIFPPGKLDNKHLKMLTFIHGGPADSDGDRFGADWYDWATLAASRGWLVFRPNYRGTAGYGDDFMLQISPHIVSKPGEDILAGVDALVKDGFADPDRLAIGGYSYGGYMTNWLITQTTRFKAAVTGAGAVEHAANWGNDDVSYDDAWFLGGAPWEKPEAYESEAALFQLDKVKTPTHIVQGASDVRVSYLEGVSLERAFERLGVAHSFLVFPGEGHGLTRNPWHGYIKLREELKWLDLYVK